MYAMLSILTGSLLALMVYVNGVLASHLGSNVSTLVIHGLGLIVVLLVAVLIIPIRPIPFRALPRASIEGILGFTTVLLSNAAFLRLGVSLALAVSLLGQTLAALVMDLLDPFSIRRQGYSMQKYLG